MEGKLSAAMAYCGLVLLALVWLMFGISYAGGVLLDDSCVQMQKWENCKRTTSPMENCDSKLEVWCSSG